jgi:hypothetical protein
MAKAPVKPEETLPKFRFVYSGDQNKIGRMLALLLSQYTVKDTRGSAQVRFDVYPPEPVVVNGVNATGFMSRIYVQRDVDKDDKLESRPYLLVEELRMNNPDHKFAASTQPFLDVHSILITKVEYDAKGRPLKHEEGPISFSGLPEYAYNAYEFLVGM